MFTPFFRMILSFLFAILAFWGDAKPLVKIGILSLGGGLPNGTDNHSNIFSLSQKSFYLYDLGQQILEAKYDTHKLFVVIESLSTILSKDKV